jgi:SAM-dependent methyltransferase
MPRPLRAVRAAVFRRMGGQGDLRDHLVRYAMYRGLADAVRDLPVPASILSISGSWPLAHAVGWGDVRLTAADYPAVSILDLPYSDGAFEAVVADQVLEHVVGDPVEAVAECARVLAPGGTLIHTTCFLNPRHDEHDMWRFTPQALTWLAERAGLDVVTAAGWGSFAGLAAVRFGLRYLPISDGRRLGRHLATRADRDWLITTWVVARSRTPTPSTVEQGGDDRAAAGSRDERQRR